MGNTVGEGKKNKKKAKVMKIDGEILKLKAPIKVSEVITNYPNHVLLESNAFKRFGIRANPMDPEEYLEGGMIYFLVELPQLPEKKRASRRVKSEVNLTEKERRELVMMSVSSEMAVVPAESGGGLVRVKVRLPKVEVDKLIGESRDEAEVAGRIVDYCVKKKGGGGGRRRLGTVEI